MSPTSISPRAVPPDARAGVAPPAPRPLLDRLIARDRVIVAVALALAAGLAWLWLLAAPRGGGMAKGMAMPGAGGIWTLAYLGATFVMWALMMVAMMLPSAAPMILLYSRFARQASPRPLAYTAAFLGAYVAVWTLFSLVAALAQAALVWAGAVSAMSLALGNLNAAGALLVLAGLYQLSTVKQACLDQCRSPLSFFMRRSRPGPGGAFRLGLAHGLFCLGCCWALMLLLFVGGVMNLAWIAGLALIVLAEKALPARFAPRSLVAGVLLVAGLLLLLAPRLAA